MARTLTVTISDEDYQRLLQRATQAGRSPEALVEVWLVSALQPIAKDPLIQLSGSIQADVTDVSERHDDYIGQALYDEMRGRQDG